jgi:hypothetical protein
MKELKPGEIGIVNLKLRTLNGSIFYLNDVVFSHPYDKKRNKLSYDNFDDRRLISKTKFKQDLFIVDIEVLQSVVWKNKSKNYTEHKANKPLQRNIDGSYD